METTELTTTECVSEDNSVAETQHEPETENTKAVEEQKTSSEKIEQQKEDAEQILQEIVPKKFLDKDGNVNVRELAKSYTNIEHLVGEKAQWIKEKGQFEEQIKKLNASSNTASSRDLLFQQASAYAKFIEEANNPKEVAEMLETFNSNPTEELLKNIESNFDISTIKKAAAECEKNSQLITQKEVEQKALEEGNLVKKFVSESILNYPTHFGNPAFSQIFQEAVGLLGANFNVGSFVGLLENYANSKIYEFLLNCQKGKDNQNATNELSGIMPNNKTKKTDELPPADLLKIQDTELLKKYIKKYSKK